MNETLHRRDHDQVIHSLIIMSTGTRTIVRE